MTRTTKKTPEKITLQEIARAAKVSLATASRALNKTGRVSPEVDRRVKAALAKLGSAPQRTDRPRMLCFLLGNRPMLHPFHAQVLVGAQSFAAEQESHVLFYPFNYNSNVPAPDIRLPTLFDRRGLVDGYIVGGVNSPNLLELLASARVPFAVLGNNVLGEWRPETYDVVWNDEVSGAYELTRYLLRLGHRAIWFLATRNFPSKYIYQGYRHAMEEEGLQPLFMESDLPDAQQSGFVGLKELVAQKRLATAVFAHSDIAAHGAMEAAAACGLKVPTDISIAGFGNRPEAIALSPSLTTVWGFPELVGRRLTELVLRRISNPDSPPGNLTIPTRFIERNSCSRPPEQASLQDRDTRAARPEAVAARLP